MIGQNTILQYINNFNITNMPRFILISGKVGQGKKTLTNEIIKHLKILSINYDTKIDSIRNMIQESYKQTQPIIYTIYDCQNMSLAAKNSILKVIEEPPNNAYFIFTVDNIRNLLSTIVSRCSHIPMENYTYKELTEFIPNNTSDIDKQILLDNCTNKHEIDLLLTYNAQQFDNFVNKVVDNIATTPSSNVFKITDNLNVKDDTTKYDLNLFLQCVINKYFNKFKINKEHKNYDSILITYQVINELNITGINKQSLIDKWILEIRKIWR